MIKLNMSSLDSIEQLNLANYKLSPRARAIIDARAIHRRIIKQLDAELREKGLQLFIHDGPSTEQDKEGERVTAQLLREKYMPIYFSECDSAGIDRKLAKYALRN